MTEKEKMLAGMVYEAVLDEDLKERPVKVQGSVLCSKPASTI